MQSYLVTAHTDKESTLEIFIEGINAATGSIQDLIEVPAYTSVDIREMSFEEWEKLHD